METPFQTIQSANAVPATEEEQSTLSETPIKYSKTPSQAVNQKMVEEQSTYWDQKIQSTATSSKAVKQEPQVEQ